MLIIEYCKEGIPVNDFEVEEVFDTIRRLQDGTLCQFSTENIFLRIRYAIVCGNEPYQEWRFRFEGKDITINEYGAVQLWPKGFLEYEVTKAEQILTEAMKKHKAKKLGG